MRGLVHRCLVIEDFVHCAERKDQDQAKSRDEGEEFLLLAHGLLRCGKFRAAAARYSSTNRNAWPVGSRSIMARWKPSLACASWGIATTSGVMNCAPALRSRSVSTAMFWVTSVVCQCQRSVALVSAGSGRAPGGVM